MLIVVKVDCHSSQLRLCDEAWIHLLKLYKKRFLFADKSILWKNAFLQSWVVPRQGLRPTQVVVGCRPRLGANLQPPPELVGRR